MGCSGRLCKALYATVTSHNTVTSLDTVERVDRVLRAATAASGEELLLISLTTKSVRFRHQQETN